MILKTLLEVLEDDVPVIIRTVDGTVLFEGTDFSDLYVNHYDVILVTTYEKTDWYASVLDITIE